jgi:hypothetical protein
MLLECAVHAHLGQVIIVHLQAPKELIISNLRHRVALTGSYQKLSVLCAYLETLLIAQANHAFHVLH